MSSVGPDSIDFEQDEINKLKQSLTELFQKPDTGRTDVDDMNVIFRLDNVEGVLKQNYVNIKEMTDRLKGTLHSAEKVIWKKFEDEKHELILKTKKDTLRDIACILTDIVAEHKMDVDDKTEELLAEQGEDINVLIDSGHYEYDEGNFLVAGGEKGDIVPEKLMRKIDEFFGTGEQHSHHLPSSDKEKIQNAEEMLESPIWRRFVNIFILK